MNEKIFGLSRKRVWVAGHGGMVGSALVRRLAREDVEILTADRRELDLTRQQETEDWIKGRAPDVIFLAAAKVGGILANATFPADFLYRNLAIETNVVEAAFRCGVKKLVFLGSSCIYPKFAPQPIAESALLTGQLEPTNEWYAVAKIAGIKLAQAYRAQHGCDFISAMPTNLYGPNDNFDLNSSHVVPALLRKAHLAKINGADSITIWGSGSPRREFLHVDDCADALVFLCERYSEAEHINVGSGIDISILDLARLICDIVGFRGRIALDERYPDGTPLKLMSADKISGYGWRPSIELADGLRSTYQWYLGQEGSA